MINKALCLYYDLNGGSPNSSGLNSSSDPNTKVASFRNSSATWWSGTITHCMPADRAAFTPFGASSNTRHYEKKII